jgi:hypothetical protein
VISLFVFIRLLCSFYFLIFSLFLFLLLFSLNTMSRVPHSWLGSCDAGSAAKSGLASCDADGSTGGPQDVLFRAVPKLNPTHSLQTNRDEDVGEIDRQV